MDMWHVHARMGCVLEHAGQHTFSSTPAAFCRTPAVNLGVAPHWVAQSVRASAMVRTAERPSSMASRTTWPRQARVRHIP